MKKVKNNHHIPTLVDFLVSRRLMTAEQLNRARESQRRLKAPQKSFHEMLVDMGYITEEVLIEAISEIFNIPVFDIEKEGIDLAAVKLISDKLARRYKVFPVRRDGDSLILAMVNPHNVLAVDEIELITKMRVRPFIAKKGDIIRCIEKHYYLGDNLYDILKNITNLPAEVSNEGEAGTDTFELKDIRYKSSVVVRLANFILGDAIKHRASDIHIEPQRDITIVRYRIDGELKGMMKVPKLLHSALTTRIKILTKLDISECNRPQDGRVRIVIDKRSIDLRISIIPTFHGEKIALRLLDPQEAKIELDKLGLRKDEFDVLIRASSRAQGMILATGPTSSGKTSTLYAALNFIKDETKNIVTIEDPIEYLIEGITQMQVNHAKNMTFANGLRHILRQDPNVILVGEIRDREAGEIAFRASLTGHLVFSTLHTNNAVSSITRLLDMGLEPGVIASSLVLVISQRLVRVICPLCREGYTPDVKLLDEFGLYIDKFGIDRFYRGGGCERCNFTGYFGRTAIFEILKINKEMKGLIADRATELEIFNEAKKNGLKLLVEAGIEKVAMGITTLEELASCVYIRDEEMKKNDFADNHSLRDTYSPTRSVVYPKATQAA